MLAIGSYLLSSRVVLAPMAGVSDRPFRQLCRRFGAGLAVSEMVISDVGLWSSRKSTTRLDIRGECGPISMQIAGSDPRQMAAAARACVEAGAQIVDINMGCPAKKVCNRAAGSALLRDEALVQEILEAVVSAVAVPVTLKIRTGWSPEQRNGVTIARIAEQSGVQALAVHGRTRACKFEGSAEYDTIAAIKAAVSIPVLANGDIDSPQKAAAVLAHTGADGVMIGRAARGQPWLCGQIDHYLAHGELLPPPDAQQRRAIAREHLAALHAFYGEDQGIRIARKQIGWYLDALREGSNARRHFNQLTDTTAQCAAIEQIDFADIATATTTDEDLAA